MTTDGAKFFQFVPFTRLSSVVTAIILSYNSEVSATNEGKDCLLALRGCIVQGYTGI